MAKNGDNSKDEDFSERRQNNDEESRRIYGDAIPLADDEEGARATASALNVSHNSPVSTMRRYPRDGERRRNSTPFDDLKIDDVSLNSSSEYHSILKIYDDSNLDVRHSGQDISLRSQRRALPFIQHSGSAQRLSNATVCPVSPEISGRETIEAVRRGPTEVILKLSVQHASELQQDLYYTGPSEHLRIDSQFSRVLQRYFALQGFSLFFSHANSFFFSLAGWNLTDVIDKINSFKRRLRDMCFARFAGERVNGEEIVHEGDLICSFSFVDVQRNHPNIPQTSNVA